MTGTRRIRHRPVIKIKISKRNNQCTRTNITTIVDEITRIVNRIKSLTIPCGSRLTLILSLSGRYFSCCLLLSPRRVHGLFKDGRLSSWLQFLRPSRLTWTANHEPGWLPSWLQVLRPSRMRAAAKCKAGRQSWLQFLRLFWLTGTAKHEAGLLLFLQPLERLFFGERD